MKDRFVRLFDFEEFQTLLTKGFDEDHDKYVIDISTAIGGTKISIQLGFENEESRDKVFNNYGRHTAESFRLDAERMLNEAVIPSP